MIFLNGRKRVKIPAEFAFVYNRNSKSFLIYLPGASGCYYVIFIILPILNHASIGDA